MIQIKNKKWKNLSLLILGLTAVVLVFEIIPRGIGVVELLFELISNNNKIERSSEIELEQKKLNIENAGIKKEIESFVTNYDDRRQISSVLSAIEEVTKSSNCELVTIKPAKIEEKKNLRVQNVELLITGQYENLYNFLRFMENSPKVMLVNNLDIAPGKTKSTELEMKINIEVYLNL